MSNTLPVTTAILVAQGDDVEERLYGLFGVLIDANIIVTVVSGPDEAASQLIMSDGSEVQCVLIDASHVRPGDPQAHATLVDNIRRLAAIPDLAPVVVASSPSRELVIHSFRAGAGDLIDLDAETDAQVTDILQRVSDRYQNKVEQRESIRRLRIALEDFLKNLVQSERRSIDLEHQLALRDQRRGQREEHLGVYDPNRPPAVFIVEDDREVADFLVERLEDAEMITFAFVSGEEAVKNARAMVRRGQPIDLALVDARLPGMDGIEAIRQLRQAKPNLAAILMTGYSDSQTAISAADLGVVGYVLKPFDDVAALVKRIRERALQNMTNAREHHYLERIKQRHEKILLRYRKLAADLERLQP